MISKLMTLTFLIISFSMSSQTFPNFNITDTQGNEHDLYQDYLNQSKVVVIKLFFVACPPCNASAPDFQAKYVEWGEGSQDVDFFFLSTKTFDDNSEVNGFKNNHGLAMPGAGNDGGAYTAVTPILNGEFGTFFGTPSYAVIAPDGTVQYPVYFSDLNDAIDAASEIESNSMTTVNTAVSINANGITPTGAYKFHLKSASSDNPKVDITDEIGSGEFSYPISGFENITDPVIVLESLSSAPHPSVTASDLSKIQKHILGIEEFTNPAKILASDGNGSGTLSASDLSVLQKSILNIYPELPNDVPGYFIYPNEIPIEINPGSETDINIQVYRMGNVNF